MSTTRRRVLTSAAVAVCIAAVAGAGYWWIKLHPVFEVQREVAQRLVDPDSAKFEDVVVSPSTGAACGAVNAKNRMGGYTGFTRFTYSPKSGLAFRPDVREHGRPEDRIEDLQKLIAYLDAEIAACPELAAAAAAASAANAALR